MVMLTDTPDRKSSRPGILPGPEFLRYLLAGLASFATDYSVFLVLIDILRLDEIPSHWISRPIGGVVCFLINRRWTFHAIDRGLLRVQIARFWLVWGMSYALTTGLLALFSKVVGLPAEAAKPLAEGLAVIFNFLCLKFWTFR